MKKNYSYILIMAITMVACAKDEEVSMPDNLITFSGNNTIVADSYSKREIMLSIDPAYLNSVGSAAVTAEGGTISPSSVNFDSNGKAYVYFMAGNVGNGKINITVKSRTYSYDMTAQQSYPEFIYVNHIASESNDLDKRIDIDLLLDRNNGKVSEGTMVTFTAIDGSGISKGSFFNVTNSDVDQKIKAEYWLQDTTFTGFIYFKAQCITSTDTIEGSNKVFIID
jgi:hypothetical protein